MRTSAFQHQSLRHTIDKRTVQSRQQENNKYFVIQASARETRYVKCHSDIFKLKLFKRIKGDLI